MIAEVDTDFNGEIEFEEFVQLMTRNMDGEDDEAALVEAFHILDADKSGHIERNELQDLLRSFAKVRCVDVPLQTPPCVCTSLYKRLSCWM